MMNNNYFNKPQSSKTYMRQNLAGYHSVYVKKWVDYSSKYWLGYLLSDGTTGIYFNDSTKMVIDDSGQYFYVYAEKQTMLITKQMKIRD